MGKECLLCRGLKEPLPLTPPSLFPSSWLGTVTNRDDLKNTAGPKAQTTASELQTELTKENRAKKQKKKKKKPKTKRIGGRSEGYLRFIEKLKEKREQEKRLKEKQEQEKRLKEKQEQEKRRPPAGTPVSLSKPPQFFGDRDKLIEEFEISLILDEDMLYTEYIKANENIKNLLERWKNFVKNEETDKASTVLPLLKEKKLSQLKAFYSNEDLIISRKRTTGFFLVSAHGGFAQLEAGHEESNPDSDSDLPFPLPPKRRLYPIFDNEAKLFFRLPPKVRLFFPTLGQGCMSVSTCHSEPILWQKLTTSRSNLFFEDPTMETNRDIRQLLEATRLYTEGDLFPNFLLSFDLCNNFDVFSISTNPEIKDGVTLQTNAWGISSVEPREVDITKEPDINKDLVYTLSEVVDFLDTQVPRPEGQVLDIVLQCCNPQFVCDGNEENKNLEKRTRARWQVLLDEGATKMMEARQRQQALLAHEQTPREKSPLVSTSSRRGGNDPMFEFEDEESKERQHQRSAPTDRTNLFTKDNCICIRPCEGGKCKTEPTLCHNKSEDTCVSQEAGSPKKEADGISSMDQAGPKATQG